MKLGKSKKPRKAKDPFDQLSAGIQGVKITQTKEELNEAVQKYIKQRQIMKDN